MWLPQIHWWELVIRACVIYVAILFLLRIAGKRQIGQMSMIEFVVVLLISNAVQNSMNGGDNSILGGVILSAVLIGLSMVFAQATHRSSKVARWMAWIRPRPTRLIHD